MVYSNQIKCQRDFITMMQDVVRNSGKFWFRRGNYNECLQTPEMRYTLVEFAASGVDTKASVGLCLPASCSNEHIIKSIDSALKIVHPQISVLYIDSNIQEYQFSLTWVSYLTIFIMISVAVLVVIASWRKGKGQVLDSWLNCFEATANLKSFQQRKGEALNIFDGIRATAMILVVLGHVSFKQLTVVGFQNMPDYKVQTNSALYLVVINTVVAVDMFLLLGGFFLAFVMLKLKQINLKVLLGGTLQRALRIWPCYILAMLFQYSLFMATGSGVIWSRLEYETSKCSSMWRQILFVSNLVDNGKGMCLDWGWYLQIDFQLFILGLCLIYLQTKSRQAFMVISAILCLGSLAYNFWYVQMQNLKFGVDLKDAFKAGGYFLDIYIKPYARCTSYILGLVLGVLFMQFRKSSQQESSQNQSLLQRFRVFLLYNNNKRIILEWLALAVMLFIIFLPRQLQVGVNWPQYVHSLYWALSKPLFVVGMVFMILPPVLGVVHSFFNLILTAKILTYIARISFCSYLVHMMVIYQFLFSRNYEIYYKPENILVESFGLLLLVLCLGFILTMCVELPFGNLVKLAFSRVKQPAKQVSLNRSILNDGYLAKGTISERANTSI